MPIYFYRICIFLSLLCGSLYAQAQDSLQVASDSITHLADTLSHTQDSLSLPQNDTTQVLPTSQDSLRAMRDSLLNARMNARNRRGKGKKESDSTQTADTTRRQTNTDSLARNNEPDSVEFGVLTTSFIYERDLFLNTKQSYHPDTSLTGFHRYTFVQKAENTAQNLGNFATAMYPIYYQAPEQIGTRWGMNAYKPFLFNAQNIPYFNTLSPYTKLYLAQGGQGKSHLDVIFNRNINPEWNVGAWYRRMSANRVVGNRFSRNDIQFTSQTIGLNMRFFTPNHRYKLLTHFLYYQHDNLESGGLTLEEDFDDLEALFEADNAQLLPQLDNTETKQTGKTFRLYQEFSIAKQGGLQLFHHLDYSTQDHKYLDESFQENLLFYDSVYFDASSSRSSYRSKFAVLENQAGVKGRVEGFQYRGYLKYKTYDFKSQFIGDSTLQDSTVTRSIEDEMFVGGGLRYTFDSITYLDASLEYLLGSDYRIAVVFTSNRLKISHLRSSYSPDLMQQQYLGNHFKWDNTTVENTLTDQSKISYSQRFENIGTLTPYATYTQIKNLMYYDSTAIARQDSGKVNFVQLGLKAQLKLQKWKTDIHFIYAKHLENELLPMPEFFVNAMIYYQDPIRHRVLRSQIGLDVHWKSSFRGNAFMPVTQQFHLQNRYDIGDYVLLDFFFNFQIKKVSVFTKVNNLLDRVFPQDYFDTPLYMGQPRSFELGFQWLFFD